VQIGEAEIDGRGRKRHCWGFLDISELKPFIRVVPLRILGRAGASGRWYERPGRPKCVDWRSMDRTTDPPRVEDA
jgi:hypothetical protein